jgi:hypothetical protein
VECSFDASKYSTIFILAIDDSTVTQACVDIQSAVEHIEKRDLSLTNPLDQTKYYNEVRNAELLKKGSSHIIEDITSTEYLIVNTIEKVQEVQTAILKANGSYVSSDLDFLSSWHTLSEDEKHKKYSQYACHEINLFVFFNDPAYFKQVVQPFVANKMEKTFIDHWLLENHEEVVRYKDIEYFNYLNALEKCLLISEIVKDSKQDAEDLVMSIKSIAEVKEVKTEERNKIFDIVINLNMSQKHPIIICDEDGDFRMENEFFGAPDVLACESISDQSKDENGNREESKLFDDDFEKERKNTKVQFQEVETTCEY